MVHKRHVPLFLVAVAVAVLLFSWMRIPEALGAAQKTFVLNPDSPAFSFEESSFNDSSASKEYYNTSGSWNATYWVNIPRNSTILNATVNLTGKIIYVYSIQTSSSGIRGLSIGNAQGSENLGD
jgi:hypothetical protein